MASTTAPAARTARERARAEITLEIKEAARRQLAVDGSAALSLRAVARELGMVSSAIYRYYPSRDDLLTALIIDAYDAVGETAENADARCRRADLDGRWLAVCRAVRAWALANPHEYALVYGSPVPGYAAPQDTVGPASRITAVLITILLDGYRSGALEPREPLKPTRRVRADLTALRERLLPELPEPLWAAGLMAWAQLFGAINLELFGHLHNVIDDHEAWFDHEMRTVAVTLGLRG